MTKDEELDEIERALGIIPSKYSWRPKTDKPLPVKFSAFYKYADKSITFKGDGKEYTEEEAKKVYKFLEEPGEIEYLRKKFEEFIKDNPPSISITTQND